MKNRDLKDLSISYVYEEDDPKKVPNRRLGELLMDKQVFASRENTDNVKVKNQILRDAFLNGHEGHISK